MSERSLSFLLSCSHLSQELQSISEVSEDTTCVTKGPAGSLQNAEINVAPDFPVNVFS